MATTRPHLTIVEVLAITEEDLRIECLRLEIPASGLDKTDIQRQLLGHIVAMATSTPASRTTRAPPVYAAVNPDPAGPDQEGSIREEPNLEEDDPREEDFEAQDHDLQDTLYSHLAREIPFSIIGMSRILPLPTGAQD